jgi:hypothetical protein
MDGLSLETGRLGSYVAGMEVEDNDLQSKGAS